ncbi:dihydropteroate synthase [Heliorestis acidaminivorans]|uniref:Dihydropteroate synthase n=1 Tax=Heliorestis acidaminivorans TaxID=553427 RepID=A0A6I0F3Q5_9FIRM|nr:dihydropteroate synthase [Heliorestis acidaminivorans]KAB2953081.1 dihydropteroate synthase [Heliorestis acidaminivorans]
MGPVQIIQIKERQKIAELVQETGCDPAGTALMVPKAVHYLIRISDVPAKAANLLKQEMLAKGGDCAVSRCTCSLEVEKTTALLMGTEKQYKALLQKLKMQPFGLVLLGEEIAKAMKQYEQKRVRKLSCRGKEISVGERSLIMAILNLTPDSFSDGGSYKDVKKALERMEEMVTEGADLIDIGAESTRPGAIPLTAEEEIARLQPFLQELVKHCPLPISIDTYKSQVARYALEEGAHIINDVWGLRYDREIATVAAQYGAPLILMHNQKEKVYQDLMANILASLAESINWAQSAGLAEEAIIIDPGIGFGKTYEQNLQVLQSLQELRVLGKPILLGTSRKSVIGNTLDVPIAERLEGTLATSVYGIIAGADILRVHDVQAHVRAAKMTDVLVRRN